MNRASLSELTKKLNHCMDELSKLLDNIYQFPHRQRELFYERIQSLKQSLTAIRTNLKESSLATHERNYQQIYLKINELRSEIMLDEASRKRKHPLANITPKDNLCRHENYEQIMETIVKKDQDVRRYKMMADQLERSLRAMENKEEIMREEIMQIKTEVTELNRLNMEIVEENAVLKNQIDIISRKNIEMESLYSTHKEVIQCSKMEEERLKVSLQDTLRMLKNKNIQTESLAGQLAALKEKYQYERKEYASKQQCYKSRQKHLEKQIKELEAELAFRTNNSTRIEELRVECLRYKEDIHVLEAELEIKRGKEEQKDEKIRRLNEQLSSARVELQQRDTELSEISIKLRQISALLHQTEHLERRATAENRLLQQKVAELQQQKMMQGKKLKQLDKKILVGEQAYKQLEERNKNLNVKIQILHQTLDQQKLSSESYSLEYQKCSMKNEELSRIIDLNLKEKQVLSQEKVDLKNRNEEQQGRIQKLEEEIASLKKRLLRAKIECIHNIREMIL